MYIDDINRRVLFPTHEELEETLSIVNALSDDQKMESRKSIKPINRALRVFVRDDWHAAFESVLRARGKVNTILTEYELGVEPDRVDFLVLILDEGVDFDGPAFRHFRKFNILEYKGGTDRVTEEVVRKTVAYGNNYCCLPGNKGVSRDTTLTILFETMSQFASGDELRETGTAGVYTLGRYTDLSLYVIILGELEGKDYAAYRAISARPQKEDLKEVLLAYTKKRVPLGPLVTLVANKNPELFNKVNEEMDNVKPLIEIMKDEWNNVIKEERADERQKTWSEAWSEAANDTNKKTAQRMIKRGKMSYAEIAEDTGLPLIEVEKLAGTAQM